MEKGQFFVENGINLDQSFALELVKSFVMLDIMNKKIYGIMQNILKVNLSHLLRFIYKEFKSSIVATKFHPSGRVLATGSTD